MGLLYGPVVARVQFLESIDLVLGKLYGLGHHSPKHIFGARRGGERTVVTEKGSFPCRRQKGTGILALNLVAQRGVSSLGYFRPKILDQLIGAPLLDHDSNHGQRFGRGLGGGQGGWQILVLLIRDNVHQMYLHWVISPINQVLAARVEMKMQEVVKMTVNDNAIGRIAVCLDGVAGVLQGHD